MTPLPDANKKSPRVYTLTQNTDLENLAFATMQSIGQPISIEEMSEDELRRLVLVNLARLSVKGEWDGLLSGGGGGGIGLIPYSATAYAEDAPSYIHRNAPYAYTGGTATTNVGTDQQLWPFISTNTGDVSSMTISVSSSKASSSVVGAIYSTNDAGLPTTLLGSATFTTTSTGEKTQTSFSSTITLTAGETYYYGLRGVDGGSGVPSLHALDDAGTPSIGLADGFGFISATRGICFDTNAATTPSTLVVSGARLEETNRIGMSLKFG
jgi:hypothetical protein